MAPSKSAVALENLRKRGAVYGRLGIKPVINAFGTDTKLGGSIMEPETAAAMAEASKVMVHMHELVERAGEVIARHTGAEAGLVTAGGAAAMVLQAAACMTGNDPGKALQLPDTTGMKNEFVIKKMHTHKYVQQWREAGAKPVWVGDEKGATPAQIEAAIGPNAFGLAFIASRALPDSFDGLDVMVKIAHKHGLPIMVDAAAMLPPVENLRRFIDHGADMVSFSGGKAIRAPQSSGILAGRKDLIAAASLSNSPNQGVGRPTKVCREEIVGLVTALESYVKRDHAADMRRWRQLDQVIIDAISEIPGVTARIDQHDWTAPVPEVSVSFTPEWRGPKPQEVVAALAAGDPEIIVAPAKRPGEAFFINPHGFLDGEAELVAERVRAVLERKR
ncbi:MAG: aminotransferase class V-fold PLP-dependent enzyme [SAR202 cluster bacterium]|nr:aminotransferase class V-fold PLP-dependent enzyme [SAR202 cluster bacterium]